MPKRRLRRHADGPETSPGGPIIRSKAQKNQAEHTVSAPVNLSANLSHAPQVLNQMGINQRQAAVQQMGAVAGNRATAMALQRTPNDVQRAGEDQGTNVYGERNYVRISNEQQHIIDTYTGRIQGAIAPWGELRALHTDAGSSISYDDYMQKVAAVKTRLKELYDKMADEFGASDTSFTQAVQMPIGPLIMPESHKHNVSLGLHKMAQAEVARQLNQGFFPQYFKEMMTLHPLGGANVVNLEILMKEHAGLDISNKPHTYRLRTIFGAEGSAGEIVTLGGSIKAFVIEYSNDLGMGWKVNMYGASGKGGAGVSGSPIEANIESSMGSNEVNAGTAKTFKYYPPNYFNVNLVSGASAGAGMGGGYSISSLSFGDVHFDTSGLTVKAGTSVVGEAGADVSLGLFVGGSTYDKKGLAEAKEVEGQKSIAQWVPVIAAKVYFRTEEIGLDDDDQASLDQVVEAIERHEQFYPGDLFKIIVKGFASEAWATPDASARVYGVDTSEIDKKKGASRSEKSAEKQKLLNELLAKSRSQVVNKELVNKILAKAHKFTPGVMDKSETFPNQYEVIKASSPEADKNPATDRYVQVVVYYNTTAEGNVLYKK